MTSGYRWSNNLTLDSKNRLMLPMPFRKGSMDAEGVSTFFVGHENDPCLYMHTEEQHEAYVDDLRQLLGGDSQDSRDLMRVVSESFSKVTTDTQGRVTLSERLRTAGSIQRNVILLDLPGRVEIWDAEAHAALRDSVAASGLFDRLETLRRTREEQRRNTSGRNGGPDGEGS